MSSIPQDFITKLVELKNESESHIIEKFIQTKNISQDNQLQEFLIQIIELKNDSDTSHDSRYFTTNIK